MGKKSRKYWAFWVPLLQALVVAAAGGNDCPEMTGRRGDLGAPPLFRPGTFARLGGNSKAP